MTDTELKATLEKAIANMFARQPNIFDFTPETGQSEWNLAHHLACGLHEAFPGLDHDFDVIKYDYDNRRPDIVFHKRGTHDNNFLVIEIKRDGHPGEIEADIGKIKNYWFCDPLKYKFGAAINLKSDRTSEVQVLKNS